MANRYSSQSLSNHASWLFTWAFHVARQAEPETDLFQQSYNHPLGLPTLAGVNKAQVHSANLLYQLAIQILVFLVGRSVVISIENPANSYLWPALVALAIKMSLEAAKLLNQLDRVTFHACCHGSSRRKDTARLSTSYTAVNAVCDYSHPHEDWTVKLTTEGWKFDTASDNVYCYNNSLFYSLDNEIRLPFFLAELQFCVHLESFFKLKQLFQAKGSHPSQQKLAKQHW